MSWHRAAMPCCPGSQLALQTGEAPTQDTSKGRADSLHQGARQRDVGQIGGRGCKAARHKAVGSRQDDFVRTLKDHCQIEAHAGPPPGSPPFLQVYIPAAVKLHFRTDPTPAQTCTSFEHADHNCTQSRRHHEHGPLDALISLQLTMPIASRGIQEHWRSSCHMLLIPCIIPECTSLL